MEPSPARIGREALFDRLALGHAARVAVLTPNRRLAQALARTFDERCSRAGRTAWESADILPWAGFVERTWDDALHAPGSNGLPLLLEAEQEQALWEAVVGDSRQARELLSATGPAMQCREAWQLLHAWRLAPAVAAAAGNEDASAFREWSSRYERLTRDQGLVDAARAPDLLAPLVREGTVRLPGTLVLYAFDLLTPQMRAFLEACVAAGGEVLACAAPEREATAVRVALPSAREEFAAAARWARERLQDALSQPDAPAPRIGVVVPDLAQSRLVVERVFAATLHPGHGAPGAVRAARAFDVSLGQPLAAFALVNDALDLLALAGREIAFEDASRLMRSPYLAGAGTELAARARVDAALRKRAGVAVTLDRLVTLLGAKGMPRAPQLADRLARLAAFRRSELFGARTPAEWAKAFARALQEAGFPGDRGLDSTEFQTLGKWHELLAAFARLERVAGRTGYREACQRLARMAARTPFQPESPGAAIHVMGILESAGLDFDHLWVTGLTDDAWPLAARPNPFLTIGVQRTAGIPEADSASSFALDARITQGWLRAAPEVVLSHALTQGDAEASPSPLIAAVAAPEGEWPGMRPMPGWRDAIHAAAGIERLSDERGPSLAAGAGEGGTALFRDQAACPFRAFAIHRLGSTSPEVPQPGLSASDRGTLLHAVLAAAWVQLKDKGGLDATPDDALDALLVPAAESALTKIRRRRPHALEGRFAEIERNRLVALARSWLQFERGRGDFAVVATEGGLAATFGGVTVQVKLDRLDRLATGGCAVIDYKTGTASVAGWLGPRPEEPQLPLYALASGEDIAAVVFARVKAGENEFKGLARAENLVPGATLVTKSRVRLARHYADWAQLREGWQRELDALGRAFAAGEAVRDPKRGEETCAGCDQALLCRVAENPPAAGEAGEEDGDA